MKVKKLISSLMTVAITITCFSGIETYKVYAGTTEKVLAVGDTVKFDFGGTTNVASGYIGVDSTRPYYTDGSTTLNTDTNTGYTYGFLGIGENGYKASDRTDGYKMNRGMEMTLYDGGEGESADSSYVYASPTIYNVGETEAEASYDMADGTMPIRFAMNVAESSYYTVTATLANSSTTSDAVVSLFSERRHEIATNITLEPGETQKVTFNAAVMDINYQKSSPIEEYVDNQLNVVVTGKNAALASIEVTRIEHSPTIFICSDSTGCDQYNYTPYYPLQNYCGVGQGITKYFQDVMVSNQGEGGLASSDNAHFNSAKSQIQAGDYLYVEYGHNESGTASYAANLAKYYEAAHDAGAYLLLVGPIDRSQPSQYDSATNTWNSTLSGYSTVAENYVKCLIYAGEDAAKAYATALAESSDTAEKYMEEIEEAGITANGVKDAAFIDLNEGWIKFLESVTAGNSEVGTNQYSLTKFYYTYNNYGSADRSHINDYGASQAGYIFAQQIKEKYEEGINADTTTGAAVSANMQAVEAQVLKTLYMDYTTNRSEVAPDTVSDSTILKGSAPNSCYPQKFVTGVEYQYSTAITGVTLKDGEFSTADVHITSDMSSYGKVALKIYDYQHAYLGTIWTSDWLDNTSMTQGADATLHFESTSITIPSDGFYVAQVYPVSSDEHEYDGSSDAMSGIYTVRTSEGIVLSEDFSSGTDSWSHYGSSSSTFAKDSEEDFAEANFNDSTSTGFYKALDSKVTSGKIEITFKLKAKSGDVKVALSSDSAPTSSSTKINLIDVNNAVVYDAAGTAHKYGDNSFTVGTDDWVNYDIIIDLDNASEILNIGGYDAYSAKYTTGLTSAASLIVESATIDSACDITDINISKIQSAIEHDSYSWDFNSTNSVSATAGDKNVPVITSPAAYDSANGCVQMTSTTTAGGNVTIDLDAPTTYDSNSVATVTSKIAYGNLSKKYMYYYIYDSDGNIIAEVNANPYNGTGTFKVGDYSENFTGMAAHGISSATSNILSNGYTTITTTIDSANSTVKLAISSSKGSWSYTGTLPTGCANDIAKLYFYTDYNNSGRSCYVDDVSIEVTS